ncbi:MAG: arginase [Solirubrobacteraceae bacterium]|nr:arginase [Solirubrobacteraceae bacterium]
MEGAVIALLCRTSDRDARGAQGAEALATELAARLGGDARMIGSPGEPRDATWEEDLRDSRGCLLEAGGQLEDALTGGRYPVLTASDCSICLTTLPVLVRQRPDAWVLWVDAHADFNSPDTTPSGFLGGMCLAAACGVWDSGFGSGLDPARVVMCGVRDVDPGERVLLDTRGVGLVESPAQLADLLDGRPVFVHLDLDVVDPSILPAKFPAPGGLSDGGLRTLLAEVGEAVDLIGAEITGCLAPDRARRVATMVEPLLPPVPVA